jgi:replicative DNA helicase
MTGPHIDHELEALIIGHMLARKGALAEILSHCTADDFNADIYARIMDAAIAISEEGYTPSPVLIRPHLSGEIVRKLEGVSGLSAATCLANLAGIASPFQPVGELARKLSDMARRRRVDAELEAARERLATYDRPVSEAIGGVLDVAGEAMSAEAKRRGHLSTADAASEMLRKLQDAINGKPVPAVLSGLKRLDQITGGFQAGDCVIVSGRPGMGKSLILSGICRAAAQDGYHAIFFSLEMPRQQLLHRLACDIDFDRKTPAQRPIAYTRLRSGKITPDEFDRINGAAEQIGQLPLEIYETPGLSIAEISALAERAARGKPLGIIAIDYLQIVRADERYRGSKVHEITQISNAAKELARRLGWPVMLGCQLNRSVESRDNKRPTLDALRESGSIEQDADIVLGLYRPAYYVETRRPALGQFDPGWHTWLAEWVGVKRDLEISVLKNRNGPPGTLGLDIEIEAGAIRNRSDAHMADAAPELVEAS